jgi:hypothetical protein
MILKLEIYSFKSTLGRGVIDPYFSRFYESIDHKLAFVFTRKKLKCAFIPNVPACGFSRKRGAEKNAKARKAGF